jgi:hypothetical protein
VLRHGVNIDASLLTQLHEGKSLSLNFYTLMSIDSRNRIASFWSIGIHRGAAITAPFINHD